MTKKMKDLVFRLAKYLRRSERQLRCFHRCESQVEGWFKGELICFLDREEREGRLHDFKPEKLVDVGGVRKRRVDIRLQFDNSGSRISWVELKHWIRTQNGTDWYGNHWYFTTANHSACVKPDADKLLKIRGDGAKFMLVLCTDNPRSKDWNSGIENFNKKFSLLSVRPLTKPENYPDYFFLGLLGIEKT